VLCVQMRESIQDLQKKLKQINTSSTPKPRPDRSNSFETISMHDTSSYSGSYIGVSGVRSSMHSPNTEADISSVDSNPRYQRGGGRFNTFRDNNSQASHNSSRSSLTSATRRPRLHSRHNNNKQDSNQQNHSHSSQHNHSHSHHHHHHSNNNGHSSSRHSTNPGKPSLTRPLSLGSLTSSVAELAEISNTKDGSNSNSFRRGNNRHRMSPDYYVGDDQYQDQDDYAANYEGYDDGFDDVDGVFADDGGVFAQDDGDEDDDMIIRDDDDEYVVMEKKLRHHQQTMHAYRQSASGSVPADGSDGDEPKYYKYDVSEDGEAPRAVCPLLVEFENIMMEYQQ
jgi:hypothetical protein